LAPMGIWVPSGILWRKRIWSPYSQETPLRALACRFANDNHAPRGVLARFDGKHGFVRHDQSTLCSYRPCTVLRVMRCRHGEPAHRWTSINSHGEAGGRFLQQEEGRRSTQVQCRKGPVGCKGPLERLWEHGRPLVAKAGSRVRAGLHYWRGGGRMALQDIADKEGSGADPDGKNSSTKAAQSTKPSYSTETGQRYRRDELDLGYAGVWPVTDHRDRAGNLRPKAPGGSLGHNRCGSARSCERA
jgi:hypothetical protein